MTKPTERERLLARWSELQPKECWSESDGWGRTAFCVAYKGGQVGTIGTPWDDNNLLGALIEAITAREWEYRIGYFRVWKDGQYETGHSADITIDDQSGDTYTAQAPADPLLAAYVAAIEANDG